MKCMQCEESIAGTGCVRNGVCGKSAALADEMDRLIATLIELSAASGGCGDAALLREMDEHIVGSLFMTLTNTNFDMGRIKEEILFPATGDGHEAVKNAKRWHMLEFRNCRNVKNRSSVCGLVSTAPASRRHSKRSAGTGTLPESGSVSWKPRRCAACSCS